jgi:hypothetical protein
MFLSKKLFLWMAKTQVLPKQTNFGERNELPKFLLTFSFATLHTRIVVVVPQFQNRVEVSSSQEMCNEAEISSSQAALRMRVVQNGVEVTSSQAAL